MKEAKTWLIVYWMAWAAFITDPTPIMSPLDLTVALLWLPAAFYGGLLTAEVVSRGVS